jgi:nucleoside-diphosphate-sugar epimerase
MQIVFIGGTRFIGHTAAAEALFRGHRVSVLHRGNHPLELPDVDDVIVDRGDPSVLCQKLRELSADVVIDTRAMTRSDAEATVLALEVAGAPGIVLSSQDVYAQFGRLNGLPAPEPEATVSESSPLTVPYPFRGAVEHEAGPDYDKKDVETVLRAAVLEDRLSAVTVLRLPAVYGLRDPRRRFHGLVDLLDRGEREVPVVAGARLRMTHAHVRDIAHAIVLSAERWAPGYRVFNLGEAKTPTMRERAEAIAAAMDREIVWRESEPPLPDELEWLGTFPNDFVADSRAFRNYFQFNEVTDSRQRVEDIVSWARQSREKT